MSKVVLDDAEIELAIGVLRSGQLAQGPMVERFEECCRHMAGTAHAVAVSNGTVALEAALEALQISPDHEIITTPFTFAATLNASLQSGASVRLVDINPADFTVDARAVAAAATDRTAVLLPVHLYGQAAEMGALCDVAARVGATILEDAAQAHGATYHGRPVGSFGVATFSFYATKNLISGEGGVVTTDDGEVADRLRVVRNQGMRARYDYVMAGHNYRMTDLAAAVAVPQFARIDSIIDARRSTAAYYTARLRGVRGVVVPEQMDGRGHVWHQYTLRITDEAVIDRDELGTRLSERGVGSGVYYPRLVHEYACFRDHPRITADDVPEARRAAAEVISIPVHQHLTEGERERVADAIVELMDRDDERQPR